MICSESVPGTDRRRFRLLAAAAFLALLAGTLGTAAARAAQNRVLLTYAKQVLTLSDAELQRSRQVLLRGVVTGHDLDAESFYIQDETGGIRVHSSSPVEGPLLGDWVEVEGIAISGRLAPGMRAERVHVLGKAPLPIPAHVPLMQIAAGMRDGQWVEVDGIVRSVLYRDNHLFLVIASGDERINVHLPAFEQDRPPDSYIDARIKVRGVCVPRFNKAQEFMGAFILVPDPMLLVVAEPAPPMPYLSPVTPLSHVLHFREGELAEHRVHVRGTVILFRPGVSIFLTDGAANLYVRTTSKEELKPGDVIDVLGFADFVDESPALTGAIYRRIGTNPGLMPAKPAAAEILDPKYDSAFVEIESRLVEASMTDGSQDMVFHFGDRIFQATLEAETVPASFNELRPGSLVRVVGLCILLRDDNNNATSFKIRLRSADDIRVLQAPPWWTVGRIAMLSGILAAIVLSVLGWTIALKRRVQTQTVTIRRRLQHEAALEQRYLDLVENANDIVCTFDMNGVFVSVNRAGERLSGYSREELLGRRVSFLLTPESENRLADMLEKAARGEVYEASEWEVVARDGRHVALEASIRIMREGSLPVALQIIARNVTERKRTEQMRVAKEAAEAANLAKSQFLANMSHEIRTPLNAVIGYSELLKDEADDQGLTQFIPDLEKIRSAGKHLLALINDILDLSKIEAGKMQLLLETFSVSNLISEIVSTARPLVEKNGNAFRIEVDEELGTAVTDRTKARQVMLNLLSNAGKFTTGGEISLRAARESVDGRDWIRLAVSDTGIGISTENQKKLFHEFSQVDPSTTKKYGGTGLGLAISLKFCELMGGTIRMQSEFDKGSTFEVRLPATLPSVGRTTPSSDEVQSDSLEEAEGVRY